MLKQQPTYPIVPSYNKNGSINFNDLENYVNSIFSIDGYKSKMGNDKEIAVIAFEVKDKDPAQDLMNFIEKGYPFVLDSDVSTGENYKGNYQVFVEIERDRKLPIRIDTILEDVSKLTGIKDWKFRYYKNIDSIPFELESIKEILPLDGKAYLQMVEEYKQAELNRFFSKGVTEGKYLNNNTIEFKRHASGSMRFQIVDEGSTKDIVAKYQGAIKLDETSMSEVMFLTKFFGNYNIYKIDENLFFTNGVHTKVLHRI